MRARVFVGTRHPSALCYLCVCSLCPPPWLFVCSNPRNSAVADVARHGNILAFLVAVCGLPTIPLHAAAYLLSPFAPFRRLHKRACGGGHVSVTLRGHLLLLLAWLPFSSRLLRSVAWHATYLDPTSHVCMISFFFFFFCVVLYLGGLFVPPRLSLHTMLLVRGGDGLAGVPGMHVRAYLSFPM